MTRAKYHIFAGAAPIKNLGSAQFKMAEFALTNPGWHTLGGSGHARSAEKRIAESLEKRKCLEIAKYGDARWQFRWKQS